MPSSSSSVALSFHSAAKFSFAVLSLSCCSAFPYDNSTISISLCVGSSPTSPSYSLGWYSPSASASNFIYWMCSLYTITLLFSASICSHRSTKLMMSASSSSTASSNAAVISVSASWLKNLSHSSEWSFPSSAWAAFDIYSNSSSSLTVSASFLSIAATSTTQTLASNGLLGRNI
jgi:hypothetical protein